MAKHHQRESGRRRRCGRGRRGMEALPAARVGAAGGGGAAPRVRVLVEPPRVAPAISPAPRVRGVAAALLPAALLFRRRCLLLDERTLLARRAAAALAQQGGLPAAGHASGRLAVAVGGAGLAHARREGALLVGRAGPLDCPLLHLGGRHAQGGKPRQRRRQEGAPRHHACPHSPGGGEGGELGGDAARGRDAAVQRHGPPREGSKDERPRHRARHQGAGRDRRAHIRARAKGADLALKDDVCACHGGEERERGRVVGEHVHLGRDRAGPHGDRLHRAGARLEPSRSPVAAQLLSRAVCAERHLDVRLGQAGPADAERAELHASLVAHQRQHHIAVEDCCEHRQRDNQHQESGPEHIDALLPLIRRW
mmetsp:Transcript_40134/g.133846  ORF Transcript_40134/g.133846 Transcript_40134/m.133846 type:complete len:367 (+) Transcript_40134:566-1666(+)